VATAAEVKIERSKLDQLCINSIRMLAADAVQKASSGHPGLPMGMAAAVGMTTFGTSAPYQDAMRNFGFTVENVVERALKLIGWAG
jgi:transketolase